MDTIRWEFSEENLAELSAFFVGPVVGFDFIAGYAVEPGLDWDPAAVELWQSTQGFEEGIGGQVLSNRQVQGSAIDVIDYPPMTYLQERRPLKQSIKNYDEVAKHLTESGRSKWLSS